MSSEKLMDLFLLLGGALGGMLVRDLWSRLFGERYIQDRVRMAILEEKINYRSRQIATLIEEKNQKAGRGKESP